MLNWRPEDPQMYEDVQTRWQYENTATDKTPEERLHRLWRSSRDSARTPVQWSDAEHAGFTTGTPWFYVNQNYKTINVSQQEQDPDSILNFYRKAIALRKSLPVVRHGSYREHFPMNGKVFCYSRQMPGQKLLVLCSFSDKPVPLPVPKGFELREGKLILENYPKACPKALRPYETRVYLWEE